MFQIQDVFERISFCRMVIKHQEHAGKRENDEQVKRDAAHSPCKWITYCVAIDLCRMKMKKDV
jgi:hypothetical protein